MTCLAWTPWGIITVMRAQLCRAWWVEAEWHHPLGCAILFLKPQVLHFGLHHWDFWESQHWLLIWLHYRTQRQRADTGSKRRAAAQSVPRQQGHAPEVGPADTVMAARDVTAHYRKRWDGGFPGKETLGHRSCIFNEVLRERHDTSVCMRGTKGWNIIPLQHEVTQHKNTLQWRKEPLHHRRVSMGVYEAAGMEQHKEEADNSIYTSLLG